MIRYPCDRNGPEPGPKWKASAVAAGYNFKFDAWQFCRQGFIPLPAARRVERGRLCWLDADVVTLRRIPSGFIEGLLPHDKDVAYLGRQDKHSEIGFQLCRLPEALPMLERFAHYYASEEVFASKEWHSSYVFDQSLEDVKDRVRGHDMTPRGYGAVWDQSALRGYTDHLKGKRKNYQRWQT